MSDLELLSRAHALFPGAAGPRPLTASHFPEPAAVGAAGAMATGIRDTAAAWAGEWDDARRVDAALTRLLRAARDDHNTAHRETAAVLAAARADALTVPNNPILARELLRRRAARLRRQHAHVADARRRVRRRGTELRELRYQLRGRRSTGGGRRADAAVRAALSRLGRPYVWGATGPDRFDCSGLVQWAYARAGIPLQRTTYQQIYQGVAVPRSDVRPGDLVFPHTGYVQMAIGGNLVVEAPQPGASVQISRLGSAVAIRRVV